MSLGAAFVRVQQRAARTRRAQVKTITEADVCTQRGITIVKMVQAARLLGIERRAGARAA